MRLYFQIVFPIFITVLTYSVLSCFFGAKGLYSQRFLENQRDLLIKHVNLLKDTGNELDIYIKNLTCDTETIEIYAHDLGYIRDNERIVKLVNFTGRNYKIFDPGEPFIPAPPSYISDYMCKMAAFSLGLFAAGIQFILFKKDEDIEDGF